MCKKLNHINTKAWCSYLISTAAIGGSVQLAVKLKDKIVDMRPIK